MIFATRSAEHIISRVKKGKVERKRFPDGELYLRILPYRGKRAKLISVIRDGDDILESAIYIDALKRMGKKVEVIVAYMGYARQEKVYRYGEAVSADLIARMLSLRGVSFLFIDPHNHKVSRIFKNKKIVSILPYLSDKIRERDLLVVAADKGAAGIAQQVASRKGWKHIVLRKKRLGPKKVVFDLPKKVLGDAVIVDDMISTGRTIIKAASLLKKKGANKIYAMAAHGVFSGNALADIERSCIKKVIVSNTLPNKSSGKVRVLPLKELIEL